MEASLAVRKPAAWLSILGHRIPLLSGHVSLSRTKSTDQFNAQLPLNYQGLDTNFWGSIKKATAELFLTSNGGSGTSVLKGDVKTIRVSLRHRRVTVTGHDSASKLVAKETTEKWQNKKADEIVKDLASRAGVSVSSDSLQNMAGKIYQIDFNKLSDHHSFMGLISHLADLEGMATFVSQGKLHFKDMDHSEGSYTLYYTPPTPESVMLGNWIDLDLQRNLELASGGKVKVQSYNRKKGKAVSSEQSSGAAEMAFTYRHPELGKDQADKIAKKRLKENLRHEISGTATIPGDETLTALMKLQLFGTGSDFDQSYFIKTIDHEYAVGSFRSLLTFNNQSEKSK